MITKPTFANNYSSLEIYLDHLRKVAENYSNGDISRRLFTLELQMLCEELFLKKSLILTFRELLTLSCSHDFPDMKQRLVKKAIMRPNNSVQLMNEIISTLGEVPNFEVFLQNGFEFFDEIKDFIQLTNSISDVNVVKKEISKFGFALIIFEHELNELEKKVEFIFDDQVVFSESGLELITSLRKKNDDVANACIDKLFNLRLH